MGYWLAFVGGALFMGVAWIVWVGAQPLLVRRLERTLRKRASQLQATEKRLGPLLHKVNALERYLAERKDEGSRQLQDLYEQVEQEARRVYTQVRPLFSWDDIEANIVADLRQARRQVLVAMYCFTAGKIADVLGRLREDYRVEVRLLVDGSQLDKNPEMHGICRRLHDKGAEVRVMRTEGAFHSKFCVIDGKVVLTGSYNWTWSAAKRNFESLLVITHEPIARDFARGFDEVWGMASRFAYER